MRTQETVKWLPILVTTKDASTCVTRRLFLLAELASRQSVNQRTTLRAQWHYTSASLSSAQRYVMDCCKTRVNTGRRGIYSFVRWTLIFVSPHYGVGRDSVVGIETRCGLDVPGIESRLERDFLQLSRPAQGHIQPPVQWGTGSPSNG